LLQRGHRSDWKEDARFSAEDHGGGFLRKMSSQAGDFSDIALKFSFACR
jgi:hypothetical protein